MCLNASVCVHVCVCKVIWEGGEGVQLLEFDGQSTLASSALMRSLQAPPPSRYLITTVPSPSSRQLSVTKSWDVLRSHNNPQHCFRASDFECPVDTALSNFDRKRKTHKQQTKMPMTVYRSYSNSSDSDGVVIFFFQRLLKKAENHF